MIGCGVAGSYSGSCVTIGLISLAFRCSGFLAFRFSSIDLATLQILESFLMNLFVY